MAVRNTIFNSFFAPRIVTIPMAELCSNMFALLPAKKGLKALRRASKEDYYLGYISLMSIFLIFATSNVSYDPNIDT